MLDVPHHSESAADPKSLCQVGSKTSSFSVRKYATRMFMKLLHYASELKERTLCDVYSLEANARCITSNQRQGKQADSILLSIRRKIDGNALLGQLKKNNPGTLHSQRNRETFCDPLDNHWKHSVTPKRRDLLTFCVLLQHANARSSPARATIQQSTDLCFEYLPQPTHSLDLAPYYYHMFKLFTESLNRKKFSSEDEVKEAVHNWLQGFS